MLVFFWNTHFPRRLTPADTINLFPSDMLQVTLDEDNIPGMDRVDRLAKSLVTLVDEDLLAINSMEVDAIYKLWRQLLAYDHERTVPEPRYPKDQPTSNNRPAKGKETTMRGLEVAKR